MQGDVAFLVNHPQEELIMAQDLRRVRRTKFQGYPALEFHLASSLTPFYLVVEDQEELNLNFEAIKEYFNTVRLSGRFFHRTPNK